MAKLSFTKLNLKTNTEISTIIFNGQHIEIKKYLPISQKLEIVQNIVNDCMEDSLNYYNSGIVEIKQIFAIIEYYTNLTFTEKQKEDFEKTYDALVSSGLAKMIILEIEDSELNTLTDLLQNALKNIYSYNNSVAGILGAVKDSDKAVEQLKELFQETDFDLIKQVMSKLD